MSDNEKMKMKDAKKVKEFDIATNLTKGFLVTSTTDDIIINEYFQFKEIRQIIHYPGRGVEIVNYSGDRRVFYNDEVGQSLKLFDTLNTKMNSWMNSNLN